MTDKPYNPLDKINLAKSIERQLLDNDAILLGKADAVQGAGIYALYYDGSFKHYKPIRGDFKPIYVGKAIPKGGRKGGLGSDAAKGRALVDRLGQHARSIDEATNLELKHVSVRFLVVDDIWIPLGENMLIEQFKPIWNRAIDGFGNKDPGQRRATQYKSPWDVLHPGRKFAEKLADGGLTPAFLEERVADYLAGRPLKKLPKAVQEDQDAAAAEAQEAADEA
jgi:hypothetical protein